MKPTITFEEKIYPIRFVRLNNKEFRIGTMSLQNALIPVDEFVNPEAEDIDCFIFAYVEDDEIALPAKKFKEAVLNACQLKEEDI